MDYDAPGMGGERTKLTLRPPEEYDTEDTKEIEVDDLDMAEVLKLAQNEGLDPTAVEVGIRKEMKGLQDFGCLSRKSVRFQVYVHTCFLKARLTQSLSWSCCRLSVVVLWSLCRATHGLPP